MEVGIGMRTVYAAPKAVCKKEDTESTLGYNIPFGSQKEVYCNEKFKLLIEYNKDDWKPIPQKNSVIIIRFLPARSWWKNTQEVYFFRTKKITFSYLNKFPKETSVKMIKIKNGTTAIEELILNLPNQPGESRVKYYYRLPNQNDGWLVGYGKQSYGPPPPKDANPGVKHDYYLEQSVKFSQVLDLLSAVQFIQ